MYFSFFHFFSLFFFFPFKNPFLYYDCLLEFLFFVFNFGDVAKVAITHKLI